MTRQEDRSGNYLYASNEDAGVEDLEQRCNQRLVRGRRRLKHERYAEEGGECSRQKTKGAWGDRATWRKVQLQWGRGKVVRTRRTKGGQGRTLQSISLDRLSAPSQP